MTQLIGGQANSKPVPLSPLHTILVVFGVRLQKKKSHDSVVSPLSLGLTKVNLPESHNTLTLGRQMSYLSTPSAGSLELPCRPYLTSRGSQRKRKEAYWR